MKKVFSLFAALMMLVAFSSCNDDKNDSYDVMFYMDGLAHVSTVDKASEGHVGSASLAITINVANMTAQFATEFKSVDNEKITLSGSDLQATFDTNKYIITSTQPINAGMHTITDFKAVLYTGSADEGKEYVTFVIDGALRVYEVECRLPFTNASTTATRDGKTETLEGGTYMFTFDMNTMLADIAIKGINFASGERSTYTYENIPFVITADGFKIESNKDIADKNGGENSTMKTVSTLVNIKTQQFNADFELGDGTKVTANGTNL